jgi:hypothetical protein
MKKAHIFLLTLTIIHLNAIEVLQQYTLSTKEDGKKVIILTTNYGPNWLAKMHKDALSYFLDYASVHGAELFIEGMGLVANDSKKYQQSNLPITENLLQQAKKSKQFNKLYISTPDCRSIKDAKVVLSFFPIIKALEMVEIEEMNVDLLEDIEKALATNNSAITVEDYMDHLQDLRHIIQSKKNVLGAEFIEMFIKNFDLMVNILGTFTKEYTQDKNVLVSTLGLKMLKSKTPLKELKKIISLFTAPSMLAAQVCFLAAIKESEETMDPTIVVITLPIAMRVIPYLPQLGFTIKLNMQIIDKKNSLDLWSLVNLLYQSLAGTQSINDQINFLEQIKSQRF